MKYLKIFFIVLFAESFSAIAVQGSGTESDSLRNEIRTSADTFDIALAHGRLAWLEAYSDLNVSFAHLDTAFQLFTSIEDEAQLARINYKYGALNRVAGNFGEAHNYMDKYLSYVEEGEDSLNIANARFQKGVIYSLQGDFENSLKDYYTALSVYESMKDSVSMGFILNSIGIVFKNLKNYSRGIESFNRAIALQEKLGDKVNLPDTYGNIGNLYSAISEYDLAEEYFLKGLKLDVEGNNMWGVSMAKQNIGSLLIEKREYARALDYLNEAFEIQKKNNYRTELTQTMSSMGVAWLRLGEFTKSEAILLAALEQSTSSKMLKKQLHFTLSELFEERGDTEKSLYHYKQFTVLKDSLFEEVSLKNINTLQYKYESEKKDRELTISKLDLEHNRLILVKKTNQLIIAVAGSFILLIISLALWVYFRQRQNIKNKEILRLKGEQEIIQLEALIDGEEKERNRLAQDLHDGINGDLAVIKYKISSLDSSKFTSKENQSYTEAINMLDNSVEQIRRISHNLAPPSLHNFDLVEAIQQFCSNLNSSNPVNISFQYFGDRLILEKEKETAIYRIIQELLNNIIKHSGATEALVQINKHKDNLLLTVEDNGTGFGTDIKGDGIGLQNIKSRVSLLNAGLDISSSTKGTSFNIEINL